VLHVKANSPPVALLRERANIHLAARHQTLGFLKKFNAAGRVAR
jgi:hypothetical protein